MSKLTYAEIHKKATEAGYNSATAHAVASLPGDTARKLEHTKRSHREVSAELDALRSEVMGKGGIMTQRVGREAIAAKQGELNQLRAAAGLPAAAPKQFAGTILSQTIIRETLAHLDGEIAKLKAKKPASAAPLARPTTATPAPATAATAAGLTREELRTLPPAARLSFFKDGGRLVAESDGASLATARPKTATREEFRKLSPTARAAFLRSGGQIS